MKNTMLNKKLNTRRTVMAIAIGAIFAGGAPAVSALTITGTVKDKNSAALTVPFTVKTLISGGKGSVDCTSTQVNSAYTGAYTCTVADGFTGDVYLSSGSGSVGMLFTKASLTNASGAATQDFTARTDVLSITGTVKDASNVAVSTAGFSLSTSKNSSPAWSCSTVDSTTGNYTCALDTTASGSTLTPTDATHLYQGYAVTAVTSQTKNFAALTAHTISGLVKDSSGSVLAGVDVYVSTSAGSQYSYSDSNGAYSVLVPDGFTGILQFYKAGYQFNNVAYNSAVTADVTSPAANVTAIAARNISGTVKNSVNAALNGVPFYVYTQPTGSNISTGCSSVTSGATTGTYTCAVSDGFTGFVFIASDRAGSSWGYNRLGMLYAKKSITSAITADTPNQDFTPRADVLTVTGTVKDLSNAAVSSAGFNLSAGKNSSPEYNCSTVSSSDGSYTCALDTTAAGLILTPTSGTDIFTGYTVTADATQPHNFSVLVAHTISGVVQDSAGNPLSGVSVSASGNPCIQSDISGAYSCKVPDGYTGALQFYKTGYLFNNVGYNAVTGNLTAATVAAVQTWNITGTIKSSDGNTVLKDVSVYFVDSATNNWNYCGTSSAQGAYQCDVPNGSSGTLYFFKDGFTFDSVTKTNVIAAATGQDISALLTYAISGKVKKSDNTALAGASVGIYYYIDGTYIGYCLVTSASDGAYGCLGPRNATEIYVEGYKTGYAFKPLSIIGSQTGDLVDQHIISAALPNTITGIVKDVNGAAVSGVNVFWHNDDFYVSCASPTPADGAYTCHVPDNFTGAVAVSGSKSGNNLNFPVKNYSGLTALSTTDAHIQAIATVTVSGTVKDSNSAVLAGVTISYNDADFLNDVNCPSKSGNDGSYSCVVPAGLVRHLYATKGGYKFSRIDLTQAPVADASGKDFTAASNTHKISGIVSNSRGPVDGVSIRWSGGKAGGQCSNTDKNGLYYCVLEDGFSGEIRAGLKGYWEKAETVTNVTADGSKNFTLTAIPDNFEFPLCSVNDNVSCIDALTVTGGTDTNNSNGANLTYKIIKAADGSLLVNLLNANGTDDLATSGYSLSTQFRIVLKLRNYTPRALSGRGKNAAWTVGAESNGIIPVTIDISPAPTEIIKVVDYQNWPTNAADKADYETGASVGLTISDLAYYSPAERAYMNGIITVTDAQKFGRLDYAPASGGTKATLKVFIAGPHFKLDGTTARDVGYFEAHLPKTMLDYWEVTNLNQLSTAGTADTIVDSGDTPTVTEATVNGVAGGAKIVLPVHYSSGIVRITAQAAPAPAPSTPAPAPSYNPGPSTPTPPANTIVPEGGTTTVGNTTTPVEAGTGSTLNVTSGTSGATINLPKPPATDSITSGAVHIVINGGSLSVKPTESGSTVKTATVSIGGKDTTVLNVTAGTAEVKANTANQPLVSVGTGANAVVISSGSANASVITSVDKTTGVTSLTLPKSTTGNDADASVKMTIGGQDVNVKPSGGGDVVVTLKTVTVNGVSTQVVSVTGGSATVTASQPNQQLLAVGGGSGTNAIVVTADTAGTAATSSVNVSTGETFIIVSNGVVTLPTNAFAEVGNGFAAIKDGKIYAGEIAVLNSAGKITGVRLGSQSGATANVGDPMKMTSSPGLTLNVTVPILKGKVARISGTQDFGDAIAASLGAGFTSTGQNSRGVLGLAYPGGSAGALPTGDITVDTSRADGVSVTGNGKVEVVKSGVIARFAPAVTDPAQLAAQVITLDKTALVTLNESGVMQATVNGITYALQPAWVVSKADGGTVGFTEDGKGHIVYQDNAGNRQTLYPAFVDLAQVIATFKSSDSNDSAIGNDDGTVTAKLRGVTYTLIPGYVVPVPAIHAKDAWWVDGIKVYIKYSDGKTAQEFEVK